MAKAELLPSRTPPTEVSEQPRPAVPFGLRKAHALYWGPHLLSTSGYRYAMKLRFALFKEASRTLPKQRIANQPNDQERVGLAGVDNLPRLLKKVS